MLPRIVSGRGIENMEKLLVTVLTPTYNRIHTLPRLYDSLCSQKEKNFIWYVIDDGSKDGTEEYIKSLQQDAPFAIKYTKKKNGGKHTALNIGFKIVNTPLLFIVDSDDRITNDAISTINADYKLIKGGDFCGLVYYRVGIGNGRGIEGRRNYNDLRYKDRVRGDLAEVWKTEYLRKYRFPEYPGEKFIGEACVWSKMSEKYDVYVRDKAIYMCEYLEGGLSKSGRTMRIKNPMGGMAHASVFLKKRYPVDIRIKNAMLYICYGFFADRKIKEIILKSNSKALVAAVFPAGFMLYLYWRKKYGGK